MRCGEGELQSEVMVPLCLPRHNPSAFLHAYVAFMRPAAGFAVVLLAAAPDGFGPLAAARELLETSLNAEGVTQVPPPPPENLFLSVQQRGLRFIKLISQASPFHIKGSSPFISKASILYVLRIRC